MRRILYCPSWCQCHYTINTLCLWLPAMYYLDKMDVEASGVLGQDRFMQKNCFFASSEEAFYLGFDVGGGDVVDRVKGLKAPVGDESVGTREQRHQVFGFQAVT